MINISDTIRKLMIDKKITITQLSEAVGIAQPSLSRKLNNSNEDYKIAYLQKICHAMDCSIKIDIINNSNGKTLYTITDKE